MASRHFEHWDHSPSWGNTIYEFMPNSSTDWGGDFGEDILSIRRAVRRVPRMYGSSKAPPEMLEYVPWGRGELTQEEIDYFARVLNLESWPGGPGQ